jgi:hypothetical protein
VSGPEFFFAIDFSHHAASREMFLEVATRVLTQAGCASNGVLDALRAAVDSSSSAAVEPCRVTFAVQDGQLDIVLSSAAGQLWQITESLA